MWHMPYLPTYYTLCELPSWLSYERGESPSTHFSFSLSRKLVCTSSLFYNKQGPYPCVSDYLNKENSAVHISHSTCPARIMYAYFSKATLEISNFLWTQKGDPSNLYTSLMRISGAAFLVLALILFIFCRLQ